MPLYRIHRIKETPREHFRWTSHTGGEAIVKPKDYEADQTIDAATPYALWKALEGSPKALRPGDILEIVNENVPEAAELLIAKYIGFESARWFVPEPKTQENRSPVTTLSAEPPAKASVT